LAQELAFHGDDRQTAMNGLPGRGVARECGRVVRRIKLDGLMAKGEADDSSAATRTGGEVTG
jgi:hypothetical protein